MRNRQRGVSLLGLLAGGVILIAVALLGMRLAPSYIEFFAIKKAVIFSRAAPFAVPDVQPTHVKAQIVDECRGDAPVGAEITLNRTTPAGGLDVWTGTSSPLTLPGASASSGGGSTTWRRRSSGQWATWPASATG